MSMIRTAKRENPFVQLDKYFLDDNNLSFEAKGILAYVLSKPDTWMIRKTDLMKRSKSGKTRIETAMLELMSNGYLNWYRLREENGEFGEWVYDVYERPEFNPAAEKFIEEGKSRIQDRKSRNKKRNTKNKIENEMPNGMDSLPKVDNQPQGDFSVPPKVDYPPVDNPPVDNQPYSNTKLSDNDFNDIELKKEEEEEDIYIGESEISQESKEQGQKRMNELEETPIPENQRTADELIHSNPSYEYLSDFLADKEVRSDVIADVILQCEKNKLDTFKVKDVEGQYKHMVSKVKADDTIYDFASYFVGGLKRRMDLTVTSGVNDYHEAQVASERASRVVPLYNWLENRN